jgi:hypothetical protein
MTGLEIFPVPHQEFCSEKPATTSKGLVAGMTSRSRQLATSLPRYLRPATGGRVDDANGEGLGADLRPASSLPGKTFRTFYYVMNVAQGINFHPIERLHDE